MPVITALKPLRAGSATIPSGETVPVEGPISRHALDRLVAQGRVVITPDPPGTAGAKLVKQTLADLDQLPDTPEGCDPDSIVGQHAARLHDRQSARDAAVTRLANLRERITDAETQLAAADERSDFTALAPVVAVAQVLPARVVELERQLQAVHVELDAARSASRADWQRAVRLRLRLKTGAPLLHEHEIVELRASIDRLVGWPAPKRSKAA